MKRAFPFVDTRRQSDLLEELRHRAELWIPEWHIHQSRGDFGTAFLSVAARLVSEVTQRLDKTPDKNSRAFLDWLGIRGAPTRAARMPTVFRLTQNTPEPTFASARVRLQTLAGDAPVSFETEQPLYIQRGRLAAIVANDPLSDGFYLPTPSLLTQPRPEGTSSAWTMRSPAPAGAISLQLDPPLGLVPQELLLIGGKEYQIVEVKNDIVTLDRPLEANDDPRAEPVGSFPRVTTVQSVSTFAPYAAAHNRQEHVLYLGHADLLNLDAVATIDVLGAGLLPEDTEWSYWGKLGDDAEPKWCSLKRGPIAGVVSLAKEKKGAIERLKLGNHESRWIKASRKEPLDQAILLSQVQLRINCNKQHAQNVLPAAARLKRPHLTLDGLANSAPLVLNQTFLPLGREPRLFDTFYLGSSEAFSKQKAKVTIQLDLEDSTLGLCGKSRIAGRGSFLVFGVGIDGLLHRVDVNPSQTNNEPLVSFRKPLALGETDQTEDSTSTGVIEALKINQIGRPAVCNLAARILLAVSAHNQVWIWVEHNTSSESKWIPLGIPRTGSEAPVVNVILLQRPGDIVVVALQESYLSQCSLTPSGKTFVVSQWQSIPGPSNASGPERTEIALVAPIWSLVDAYAPAQFDVGFITVSRAGTVFRYNPSKDPRYEELKALGEVDPTVSPCATTMSGSVFVVAKKKNANTLVAVGSKDTTKTTVDISGTLLGGGFDFVPLTTNATPDTKPLVIFSLRDKEDVSRLGWWHPLEGGFIVTGEAPPGTDYLSDSPNLLDQFVFVPGKSGAVFGSPFDVTKQQTETIPKNNLSDALLLPVSAANKQAKTMFVQVHPGKDNSHIRKIRTPLANLVSNFLVAIPESPFPQLSDQDEYVVFSTTKDQMEGIKRGEKALELPNGDKSTKVNDLLLIDSGSEIKIFLVKDIQRKDSVRIAALEGDLPGSANEPILYWSFHRPPVVTGLARVALRRDKSAPMIGDAREPQVFFPGALPSRMTPIGMSKDLIVFYSRWIEPPRDDLISYALNAPEASLQAFRPNIAGNPKLSWEYWDGGAWWTIDGIEDTTKNLRVSGSISFYVPDNLQAVDVAGKTTHWIRSRLVEGDYGKETVTVRSIEKPGQDNKKETTQVVDRSSVSIRPPRIYGIDVAYEVCCPISPAHVLTFDNGSLLDQTDANSIDSATVEVFLPLSESDKRRSQGHEVGRSLYLGFDKPLRGEPIRILAVIDEAPKLAPFLPLVLEALRGTQFEEILLDDKTQGLSESGLLSFALDQSPTESELFGKTLYWLRLRPRVTMSNWEPRIRGLFLNAVWAESAETQEIEILGSSNGSPKQQVTLGRPPVIAKSLELRVRESIEEEEIKALTLTDPSAVVSDLPGLLGHWVRWQEVVDPEDHGPFDRVFSLDHESGTIRFGDGLHGRIPTAGLNSIIAKTYRRGGGAAANLVRPWNQLNLVTPVEGVEAAVNPLAAAGGADHEDAAAILRFGPSKLRHRGHALTAADLEQLALEYSPTVAQASCINEQRGCRLVVVVRGENPKPNREFRREMQRFLIDHASPSLARSGAFEVVAPALIPFRIEISALAANLDVTGDVAKLIRTRVRELFDPAAGGRDGYGWRLGVLPTSQDVAGAIVDVPGLDNLDQIVFSPVGAGDLLSKLKRDQLAWLIPDGIQIKFVAEETL